MRNVVWHIVRADIHRQWNCCLTIEFVWGRYFVVADQNVENYNGFYIRVRVCHRIDLSNWMLCYHNEFSLGHSFNTNCLCILSRMLWRLPIQLPEHVLASCLFKCLHACKRRDIIMFAWAMQLHHNWDNTLVRLLRWKLPIPHLNVLKFVLSAPPPIARWRPKSPSIGSWQNLFVGTVRNTMLQ